MNKVTVSAKTVNDAITEASIRLGIASTSMDYEVIEKGSAGFLGIGSKQAVITAWNKEDAKKEKPKKEKKVEKKEVKEPKKEVVKESVKEIEEVEEIPVKDEKLAEVEPQTKEACEKFLYDVLKAMDMEVSLTSEVDEDCALSINIEGENMGILI